MMEAYPVTSNTIRALRIKLERRLGMFMGCIKKYIQWGKEKGI